MANTIQDIGELLHNDIEKYLHLEDKDKAKLLEEALLDVCDILSICYEVTEGKADLEMLLQIVASYKYSLNKGVLPSDSKPPKSLFEDIVFPQIKAFEDIVVEHITEEEDNGHRSTIESIE